MIAMLSACTCATQHTSKVLASASFSIEEYYEDWPESENQAHAYWLTCIHVALHIWPIILSSILIMNIL